MTNLLTYAEARRALQLLRASGTAATSVEEPPRASADFLLTYDELLAEAETPSPVTSFVRLAAHTRPTPRTSTPLRELA